MFLIGDLDRDLEREREAEWWRLLVSGDLLRLRDLLLDFDFDLEWDRERDRLADREARRFGGGLREREREWEADRERRLTGDREWLRRLALLDLDRLRPRRLALLDLERERDLRLTGLRERLRRRLLERDLVGLRRRLERERERERDLLRLFSSMRRIRRPLRSVLSNLSSAFFMSEYVANSTTPSLRRRRWASA